MPLRRSPALFRCPGVVDCEPCRRRVRKLYLPPREDLYRCRHCYGLSYTTSRTSGDEVKQVELRYRRAFAKADAEGRRQHPNGEPYFPKRPKGMHHETFEALLAKVKAAQEAWEEAFDERLWTMAGAT